MIRPLVRPRPSWPGMVRSRLHVKAAGAPGLAVAKAVNTRAAAVIRVRCQSIHSTAPAYALGFKNFKNSPRLDWRTQQQMDAKNAVVNASRPEHVPYTEALEAHRPRAWAGARKKVVWSRLFGPSDKGIDGESKQTESTN